MIPPDRLRDIVILGGGVAGWMAAAALARYAATIRVTLIDCAVADTLAQTTLPAQKDFHALLGIDEHVMLSATGGTMRLGTRFSEPEPARSYLHAFGDFGLEVGGVLFHQLWLRARAAGEAVDLDHYNLAALAATMGRFAKPAPDKRAMMDYGYHFETAAYRAHLRELATGQGVGHEIGEVETVSLDDEGAIAAIGLIDGRSFDGDLFIDCSGPVARLIGAALQEPFESWSAHFPGDRELSVLTGSLPDLPPLTDVTLSEGLKRRIPLRRSTAHSLSFAARDLDDSSACAHLDIVGDARFVPQRMGRHRRLWVKNCVAIGAAGVGIEPIEAGEIDFARTGILRLLALLPDRGDAAVEVAEFQSSIDREIEEVRNLTLLHKLAMSGAEPILRIGTDSVALPDSLAHRVALFRGRGRLRPDEGIFRPADWLAVLTGRGLLSASWDPSADMIDTERVSQNFLRLEGLFRQSAETMPTHAAYLARHCPISRPG